MLTNVSIMFEIDRVIIIPHNGTFLDDGRKPLFSVILGPLEGQNLANMAQKQIRSEHSPNKCTNQRNDHFHLISLIFCYWTDAQTHARTNGRTLTIPVCPPDFVGGDKNATKDMCSIPTDVTVVLGLHKFILQATIDHHGPSRYSGHCTTSINCWEKICCNDSKITEIEMIHTKNSSTGDKAMHKLIT